MHWPGKPVPAPGSWFDLTSKAKVATAEQQTAVLRSHGIGERPSAAQLSPPLLSTSGRTSSQERGRACRASACKLIYLEIHSHNVFYGTWPRADQICRSLVIAMRLGS